VRKYRVSIGRIEDFGSTLRDTSSVLRNRRFRRGVGKVTRRERRSETRLSIKNSLLCHKAPMINTESGECLDLRPRYDIQLEKFVSQAAHQGTAIVDFLDRDGNAFEKPDRPVSLTVV
jgi:hypothetical protein